jgi:hypothetical protein
VTDGSPDAAVTLHGPSSHEEQPSGAVEAVVDHGGPRLERAGDRPGQARQHDLERLVGQERPEELVEVVLPVPPPGAEHDPVDPGPVEHRHRADLDPGRPAVGEQHPEHHRDPRAGLVDLLDLRDHLDGGGHLLGGQELEHAAPDELRGLPRQRERDRAAGVADRPVPVDDHERVARGVDDPAERLGGQLARADREGRIFARRHRDGG